MTKVISISKSVLLIAALSLSLQACVPVLVAGAAAGGVAVYDRREIKQIVKDRNIAHQASFALNADPEIANHSHIVVSVFNKIMLLVGQAPTAQLRSRAYKIASKTKGVRRIYNEISVSPPTSDSARIEDTWITTKVKASLLGTDGLHVTQIKVVTENRVVYLMGIVTKKEAGLASRVASKIAGVKEVVKLFELGKDK